MNKIKCRYKKVKTIIKHYGYDWSNLMLDGVYFVNKDLTKITLPDDPELFQKTKDKSLGRCELPKGDYSEYNFEGVNLQGCKFTKDSILPNDPELFRKIKYKSLDNCKLPKGDYSGFNFEGVTLGGCAFTEDIILPSDSELFQKLYNKYLWDCKLPKGDYSGYNFEGVDLRDCWFTEDSILPSDKELFQKIKDKDLCRCKLPNSAVNEIHLYNLDGVIIDLTDYNNTLTKLQHSLIRAKYPSQVGKNIKLPNYEDCVDDLKEEVAITSEFDF